MSDVESIGMQVSDRRGCASGCGLTRESQVGPDGAARGWYTASYDATGNRLGQAELDGSVVSYGYDAGDQLRHEVRAGTEAYDITYGYDRVGNRTQQIASGAMTTMTYNEADELVGVQAPDGSLTTTSYDANGNTEVVNANGQVTTNSWGPENRLVGVVNPDATVETHAYAANGLRQSKAVAGAVTNFLWDEQNILQERDGALSLLAHYTALPGYWGGLASMRRSGASSYYGFDQQGTARALLNALAVVSDRYWITAFGEEIASSGATANPFRFEGLFQYYRDSARRMQVRMRDGDPVWGRWLSRILPGRRRPTPIELTRLESVGPRTLLVFAIQNAVASQIAADSYNYALGNPVAYVDPSGMRPPSRLPPPPLSNLAGIRAQCKNLNPASEAASCGGSTDRCDECCGELSYALPSLVSLVLEAVSPGPVTIPSSRIASCLNACEKECRNVYASGSLAMSGMLKCLGGGTMSDMLIGLLLELLGALA